MTSIPLVSVCVATFNYARFLTDCIESVHEQTFADWELIVCDDASTDSTAELVQRYAAQDARIRYVRNAERLGMNANLKKAAELGRGRYIRMLCADDWLAPRCLAVACRLMEDHPHAVLATSASVLARADGTPVEVLFLFGEPVSVLTGETMLDRMARGEGFGGNSNFFIRRSAYEAIGGYDAALLYAADYDLAARLCRVGDYLHTDEPLFYGREHVASSSSLNPRELKDVPDWFHVPDKVFRPRRLGSREWRRYHRLTAQLTARYMFNVLLEIMRGHATYARGLTRLLLEEGNFLFGLPWLPFHIPARVFNRLTGCQRPRSAPAQPWMGAPSARGPAAVVNRAGIA